MKSVSCVIISFLLINILDQNVAKPLDIIDDMYDIIDPYYQEDAVTPNNNAVDRCFLPPVKGMCRANMPRYFYNSSTKNCQLFRYGGCGGNRNNFQSFKDCMRNCDQA